MARRAVLGFGHYHHEGAQEWDADYVGLIGNAPTYSTVAGTDAWASDGSASLKAVHDPITAAGYGKQYDIDGLSNDDPTYTLGMAFRCTPAPGDTSTSHIAFGLSTVSATQPLISIGDTGTHFEVRAGGGGLPTGGFQTIPYDTWAWIVISRVSGGSFIKLAVNGTVREYSGTNARWGAAATPNNGTLNIGRSTGREGTVDYFDSIILTDQAGEAEFQEMRRPRWVHYFSPDTVSFEDNPGGSTPVTTTGQDEAEVMSDGDTFTTGLELVSTAAVVVGTRSNRQINGVFTDDVSGERQVVKTYAMHLWHGFQVEYAVTPIFFGRFLDASNVSIHPNFLGGYVGATLGFPVVEMNVLVADMNPPHTRAVANQIQGAVGKNSTAVSSAGYISEMWWYAEVVVSPSISDTTVVKETRTALEAAPNSVSDNFNRPDGVLIETGAPIIWLNGGAAFRITDNRAALNSGSTAHNAGTLCPSFNGRIEVNQYGGIAGIIMRNDGTAANWLGFLITSTQALLYKSVASIQTLLVDKAISISTGPADLNVLAVEMNGASIKCFIGGVEEIDYTLTAGEQAIFDATKRYHGIRGVKGQPTTFDNWVYAEGSQGLASPNTEVWTGGGNGSDRIFALEGVTPVATFDHGDGTPANWAGGGNGSDVILDVTDTSSEVTFDHGDGSPAIWAGGGDADLIIDASGVTEEATFDHGDGTPAGWAGGGNNSDLILTEEGVDEIMYMEAWTGGGQAVDLIVDYFGVTEGVAMDVALAIADETGITEDALLWEYIREDLATGGRKVLTYIFED